MKRVLAIPDLHAPFQNKQSLSFLKQLKSAYRPQEVVCLGDEIDAHAISEFSHDPDGYSPGNEIDEAIDFMKELYSLFPKMKVCMSNHTIRPWKKALKCGLPARFLKSIKEALEAPQGWEWSNKWIIDDVLYIHGKGFTGAQGHIKAAFKNRMATVLGHIHSNGSVQYLANGQDQIFAMNAGCLIDTEAYAFRYGEDISDKPTLGAGIIFSSKEAYFIPLK